MTTKDILNGILYLVNQSDYKISNFEKKIGKSVGYLPRTIKDNADISFSVISRSAKVLGYKKVSNFMAKLEELSQEKNCPICNGSMKIKSKKYVCEKCGAKIEFAKENKNEK